MRGKPHTAAQCSPVFCRPSLLRLTVQTNTRHGSIVRKYSTGCNSIIDDSMEAGRPSLRQKRRNGGDNETDHLILFDRKSKSKKQPPTDVTLI
jgi:hypothetical protein